MPHFGTDLETARFFNPSIIDIDLHELATGLARQGFRGPTLGIPDIPGFNVPAFPGQEVGIQGQGLANINYVRAIAQDRFGRNRMLGPLRQEFIGPNRLPTTFEFPGDEVRDPSGFPSAIAEVIGGTTTGLYDLSAYPIGASTASGSSTAGQNDPILPGSRIDPGGPLALPVGPPQLYSGPEPAISCFGALLSVFVGQFTRRRIAELLHPGGHRGLLNPNPQLRFAS